MKASVISAIVAGILSLAHGGAAGARDLIPAGGPAASPRSPEAGGARSGAPIQVAQGRRGRGRSGDIVGRAHVIEGDVLEIRGRRIRLFGIYAFKRGQHCRERRGKRYRCGRRARHALARKIERQRLACQRVAPWHNGVQAVCWLGAEDVAAWMVLSGWAVADQGQGGRYAIHERIARLQRINAWRGEFVRPDRWHRRRDQRRERWERRQREREGR